MDEDRTEPPPPTFGELFKSNAKVVAWAALLALVAFGTWRGLVLLFPDVGWLQSRP